MLTVVLLFISNTFMTFAWYGHLKHRSWSLLQAVLFSWLIALGEYCFQVPGQPIRLRAFHRIPIEDHSGSHHRGGVFVVFAYFYLGEDLRWNYALSFVCLFAAVAFAFWGRS